MNILVTGGAGYIGSHTCVELIEAGKNSEAYAEYKDYTKALQGKYSTGV
jgi:UDP-glucose 4-epimerase